MGTLSVVVVTRDHIAFLDECLRSIKNEFEDSTPIIVVDVGSIDGTFDHLKCVQEDFAANIQIVNVDRNTTPLGAFRAIAQFISTDFISVISGDDYYLPGYGSLVRNIVENSQPNFVTHFSQIIIDENSNPIGRRAPSWTSNMLKDRRKLLYSNPGTTAGCLLPWIYIREVCLSEENFDTLIEDYYFNTKLITKIPFKSELVELVAYRKHINNLSSQALDKQYASSIGISIALSWSIAKNPYEKLLSTLLFPRWGRHVKFPRYPQLISGFIKKSL